TATSTTTAAPTAPTVASPAKAASATVTGTSTTLSVRGSDAAGEPSLTYAWSTVGTPPAAVTFRANGTNAAPDTPVPPARPGPPPVRLTTPNPPPPTLPSAVPLPEKPPLPRLSLSPAQATVVNGTTQQFKATALDQFGLAMATQPAVSFSKTAGIGT